MNESVLTLRTSAALWLTVTVFACQVVDKNSVSDAGTSVPTATGGDQSQQTAAGGGANPGGGSSMGGASTNGSSMGGTAAASGGVVGLSNATTAVGGAAGASSVGSQGGTTAPTNSTSAPGGATSPGTSTVVALPQPSVGVAGTQETFGPLSYVVPPGMTETVATDGVVMQAPRAAAQGSCFIALLSPRPAEADPDAQMLSILLEFFASSYSELRDIYGGTQPLNFRQIGISGRDWEYLFLRGSLINLSGAVTGDQARIMLIDLGTQVLPIIGFEASDNLCLDETIGNTVDWQLMYYSLDLPKYTPPPPDVSLAQMLVGKWRINGGTYFLGETYAANGHYATQSAYQTYSTISSTEIQQTTTTWLGDGAYVTQRDLLSTVPNNGKPAETHYYRILLEPNSSTTTGWLPRLYQLELSVTTGKPYEYVLTGDTT